MRSSCSCLFSRLNSLNSAFPSKRDTPAPQSSSLPFTGPAPGSPCFSYTEDPQPGHSTPDVASLGLSRGAGSPVSPCWNVLPDAPQDFIGLLGHRDTAGSWTAWCQRGPPDCSLQRCSPAAQVQPVLLPGDRKSVV